jgi:stage II sporulation protein D
VSNLVEASGSAASPGSELSNPPVPVPLRRYTPFPPKRHPTLVSPILLPVLLLVSVLGAASALPPAAEGATVHTIRGAGFGHGVGMSQYGAYGMARRGASYERILAHYYPGTTIDRAAVDRTRVLLAEGIPAAVFSGAARVPGKRELNPDRTYRAVPGPRGGVELRTARGTLIGRASGPLVVDGKGSPVRLIGRAINGISDGGYRGTFVIHPAPVGLTVVNVVGLEGYLRGVVPSEMPASWPRAALQAQAVAARSYALATARTGSLFDQYPDMRSQVYKGVSEEEREANAAIKATAGRVIAHDGRVAKAFFHSTSGGRTETSANAFGGPPLPYLRSISDPRDATSPHHRWTLSLTGAEIEARLGSLVKGRYRGVRVLKRGESPRILRAEVLGSGGPTPTTGPTLRARLELRETWASFGRIDSSAAGALRATRSPASGPAPAGVLTGKVAPAPRGGRIVVERERRGRWRVAMRAHTDRAGAFSVAVERSGRYRVRVGGALGPAVRVGS